MKPPTANRMPSTRPNSRAWLETSITAVSTDRSAITASSACSAGASGVVKALGTSAPAILTPTVPIIPGIRPAARRPDSIRCAVVVLPEVPVTPRTTTRSEGCP